MTDDDLEPLDPRTALQMYCRERADEWTQATLESKERRLAKFVDWCEQDGEIDNLNDLSGRDLHEFRLWRKGGGGNEDSDGLARTTMQTQMSTLRVFLRWAAKVDAVEQGLAEKLVVPDRPEDSARTEMLEHDTAEKVLEYLRRYEFASRDHALFLVLWRTGMRMGAARALDVDDYDSSEQYLALRHRPDTGTPLKNGKAGERLVALRDETCAVLDEYVRMRRVETTDEHGREPLFSTDNGRMGKITVRRTTYRLTRPCEYAGTCPHGREIDDCEAANTYDDAGKCPSTVSPHPIRRGSITYFLSNDVPETAVSDRMDVSEEILDEHYDQRSSYEKMQQRRDHLDKI